MPKELPNRPISLADAEAALHENALHYLKPGAHPALWNLNVGLLGICQALRKINHDIDLLHNKIQPVLMQVADNQDDLRGALRGEKKEW